MAFKSSRMAIGFLLILLMMPFFINFGYLFEVISNGKFKAKTSRQSLAYFVFPEDDMITEPAKCLINEANSPHYRSFKLDDFNTKFYPALANKEEIMKYISV
ncbi:unnamed protein product [Citrullus colocynthis]|uniref:Uncharacterized protein n=1 Tax=Citrullus colocynthis TaxID=252529 RepID=A0ABP0XT50_9ROSI